MRRIGRFARNIIKWLAGIATLALALVAALLLIMWREHTTAITLPAPAGHFAVGRSMFAWTNPAETDDLAPAPGEKRQLLVWLWYPAIVSDNQRRSDYLPASWRNALRQRQGPFMRSFFKRDPQVVGTHSSDGAPVSPEQGAYPVVILRPGGSALTTDFTTLAADLASHGFFVAGFDAPYRSFIVVLPDGRVIGRSPAFNVENANGNLGDPVIGKLLAMWTSDTRFLLDQLQALHAEPGGRFARRMDLQRLGMIGHSFGGATALQFCREDARCKAAIDLDGIPFGSVVKEGLAKPAMFLLSDHSREMSDPSSRQVLSEIYSIYERLPDGRFYGIIRGASHFAFSDQILLNSQAAIRLLRWTGFGALDGRRGLAISADYIHTFFDIHLNNGRPSSLTELASKYPEVQIAGK